MSSGGLYKQHGSLKDISCIMSHNKSFLKRIISGSHLEEANTQSGLLRSFPKTKPSSFGAFILKLCKPTQLVCFGGNLTTQEAEHGSAPGDPTS